MLTLFDAGQQWSTTPASSLSSEALALAATFPDYAPYGLRWHEGLVLMDWSLDLRFQDGSTGTATVRTSYGAYQHPALGRCLRISTDLQVEVEDPGAWCLDKNEKLTSELLDTFILGGLAATAPGRVTYTTVIPAGLDLSTSTDRHASFIGTNLSHHVSLVARLLLNVDEVQAPELTVRLLSERYGLLAEFYRESGLDLPAGLSTVLTEDGDTGQSALTVFRPWSLPGQIREWPRMGAFDQDGEPSGIHTLLPLDAMPFWLTTRFAHAAILGSAKPRVENGAISLPLATVASPLSQSEINSVLGSLVEDKVLCFDADRDEVSVSPSDSGIVLTIELTDRHPGWGAALTITASCPTVPGTDVDTSPRDALGGSPQIGDWRRDADGLRYRVCLPPQAFVAPNLEIRLQLLRCAISSVAAYATRSLGQPSRGTPLPARS
jgi:hypothetical protein